MLTDARVDSNQGDQYVRNPTISYTLNSGFASYTSIRLVIITHASLH